MFYSWYISFYVLNFLSFYKIFIRNLFKRREFLNKVTFFISLVQFIFVFNIVFILATLYFITFTLYAVLVQ